MGTEVLIGATILSAVASGISTAVSYDSAKEQKQIAQEALAAQNKEIAKQKEEALEKRKSQINSQRESMSADGSSTRGYSSKGITAKVSGVSSTSEDLLG